MNTRVKIVLSILCISLSALLQSTETNDSGNPQKWIKTYMLGSDGTLIISQQDLQVLLNVLYLSYVRSNITLEAQSDGLHALQTSWQTFQNIIQLRRNPSIELPYVIDEHTYMTDMNALYDLQIKHHRIGKMYAYAIETFLHGTLVTDAHLIKGIQEIRNDSRRSIAHALSNTREYLDTILHMCIDKSNINEDSVESSKSFANILNKSFSIGDYIWALIPNMALNSFVKTDDLTITMSEEWWKALYQLFNISNMIWKPIERARAELYLDHYKAVYLEAQSHNIDMQLMTILFDEHGLLEGSLQGDQLPDPKELRIPA